MLNKNTKQMQEMKEAIESLKEEIDLLKKQNAELQEKEKAQQEQEQLLLEDAHAEVQEKLIGEFEMSQEEFNERLIAGLQSPQVVDFMNRMLQNALAMGLGRMH